MCLCYVSLLFRFEVFSFWSRGAALTAMVCGPRLLGSAGIFGCLRLARELAVHAGSVGCLDLRTGFLKKKQPLFHGERKNSEELQQEGKRRRRI